MNEYRQRSESMRADLVSMRRKIHENPELGFQEFETAAFIKAELDKLGISYRSEIARTGIIATIEGSRPGKTLLIRADMDALPMIEDADLEFKSKNHGVFHACGHDTHVTCLLGTAKILMENRDKFGGTVLLVFQPAEEGSKEYDPTGKIAGGALPMVMEAGDVLNPDNLDGVLALHIVSGEDDHEHVGKIGVGDGPFSGSADEIFVDIIGKGGHASSPHSAVDPVYIASQVSVALQGWLTRFVDPMEPVVVTFGK
ncbi:MAG: M20 metallopeptidase family protein, partial [Candidatus Kariarchaeaceae archaeon]